jgi:hypothetical protein
MIHYQAQAIPMYCLVNECYLHLKGELRVIWQIDALQLIALELYLCRRHGILQLVEGAE